MEKRFVLPDEHGQRGCVANRPTRAAIAARYPGLPTGGLKDCEVRREERKAKFAALPEEEQARKRANMNLARLKGPPKTLTAHPE